MNEILFGLNIANWLLKLFEKKKIKETLKMELSPSLTKLNVSYENLMESYYMVMGARMSCRFFKPMINGSEKANKYTSDLKKSYIEFQKETNNFLRKMKTHKDTLKNVISEKDWIIIEVFLDSIKDKDLDLSKIYKSPIVLETFYKNLKKKNIFEINLDKGLKHFIKEEKVNMEIPNKSTIKDVNKIINIAYTNPKKFKKVIKQIADDL
jgi:hypothetical protein